jgi:large subunit ribosomal protein L9
MEIILLQDIQPGEQRRHCQCKRRLWRNYLIPKKMAIVANSISKKVWAENIRQRAHKEAKLKADAQALADNCRVSLLLSVQKQVFR